jgi:signal transduction histidine kinase
VEAHDPALLSQLIGLLVHDLRNPLAGLKCNATLLEDSGPAGASSMMEGIVEDIGVSCTMLGHLLDNAELLARELSGTYRVELTRVGLAEIVDRVVRELKEVAKSHGTTVVVQGEITPELCVVSHRDLLARVLLNFAYNGIQHGAGTPVRIVVRRAGAKVVVSVEDDGVPIAPELYDTIFTAQGQVKGRSQEQGRYSRGLGLFVAGAAARWAGGKPKATATLTGNALQIELTLG